ncbi:MAG: ABC transporter permease [Muribaculaceae bacterium]|nr:ABC transporter permease [Muribaculaceae bacterium]
MKFELFIANRLKAGYNMKESSNSIPSIGIAVLGMTLALVIMIFSIVIVCGFKKEISNKIYSLDAHIKITKPAYTQSRNSPALLLSEDLTEQVLSINNVKSICLIGEKPAVLKTNDSFKGVIYKGVADNFDWSYIKNALIDGRIPSDSIKGVSEVVISNHISKELNLSIGDKVPTYFIDNKIKARNSIITGIYNTDFEDFDNIFIIGNIRQIQSINQWNTNQGDYIAVSCDNTGNIKQVNDNIKELLANEFYQYEATNIVDNNASYFTWLDLLDMNVVIILMIMIIVSSFTLISCLLMIVLERINMIGILKTLGTSNYSIRQIFIITTNRLIWKALILSNFIAIALCYIQDKYHIIKLNPEAYYIEYVPVDINWTYIIAFNIAVIIISYLSLLVPSHVISTIEPKKTILFE